MIVRKLRLQRGWSQEHLADLAAVNVRTIQRIERGKTSSLETRSALAAVFEVDISTFDEGVSEMAENEKLVPEESEAIEYVKGIKEFYSHAGMYVLFSVVFGFSIGLENPMILWGIIGWGIGVIVHGLNVYEVFNLFGAKWEKQQIEKRLGRKL